MASHDVLLKVLEQGEGRIENKALLKKIILTSYLGWLRVNSLSPDKKYSLADYLLDEENVIFDFTRVSLNQRRKFEHWLLDAHQEHKGTAFLKQVRMSEHRGYSAEVPLNNWGKFTSWLFRKRYDNWCLGGMTLSLEHQLTGLNICYGKKGLLISFNQFMPPAVGDKYSNPESRKQDSRGNAKRVFITDQLVDQLTQIKIDECQFDKICKSPHPFAQQVKNYPKRFKQMHEYRQAERFLAVKPWYKRLFNWFVGLFKGKPRVDASTSQDNEFETIFSTDQLLVLKKNESDEIQIVEKRPDLNTMVYCGGGSKIFAHVGVYKAFCEAGITPTRYSGSSAGAIMALLSYIGYQPNDIYDFFKTIRQENILYYQINRKGLSDTNGLKSALDYMVSKRIREVTGEKELPPVITFNVLNQLKEKYPKSGIGELLFVTATKKRLGTTKYFSYRHTPDVEVTAAVTASACLPVVFKPVIIDGEELCDGGIKSNFPTEVFKGMDNSSLLESIHGNNLRLVGVQFENGAERSAVDRVKDKVYRENIFLNWIYRVITGVNDPASGWEQDRMKLREHALQSLVVTLDKEASATNFNVSDDLKNRMVEQGYQAGRDYIQLRYEEAEGGRYENDELMYTNFSSLSELLAFCCYRNNRDYFEKIYGLIDSSLSLDRSDLLKDADKLRRLYFHESLVSRPKSPTLFGHQHAVIPRPIVNKPKTAAFMSIYPVLHRLTADHFKHKADRELFMKARHSITIRSPFKFLHVLDHLKGEFNIVFHLIHRIINQMKMEPEQTLHQFMNDIHQFILPATEILAHEFYGRWNLSFRQCNRLFALLRNQDWQAAKELCGHYKAGDEPLDVYCVTETPVEDAESDSFACHC